MEEQCRFMLVGSLSIILDGELRILLLPWVETRGTLEL